ncbi:MAG: TonB-dependent receptor [Leptolyngbyaceae cyanobacterium RM1_1_2]|nr:TonB-dependent receptor [Leptolyngbyaceae cyanobacterium RM1_1_2]
MNHEFNDAWQIRNNFSANVSDARDSQTSPISAIDNRFVELGAAEREFGRDSFSGNIDLIGEFDTGSVSHQLLAGFDVSYTEDFFAFSTAENPPRLDVLDPNYNVPRPDNFVPAFRDDNFSTRYGIYLQDQIDLLDNLKFLIGGRVDWISQRTEVPDEPTQSQNDSAFSPRVGLVYQPSDTISLYTSFSQSFVPTFGSNPDGSVFEPSRGTQYEVGIKTDIIENVLSATLSAYQINKTNITTPDPNNPDFSIQIGEQRSRGVELDVGGEILPGWNITAAYAYTDAEVTEDNSVSVGISW